MHGGFRASRGALPFWNRIRRYPMAIADVVKVTSLTNVDVYNLQDEKVGTIQNLMIDAERGCIAYAVLSHGGFLGIGDKLFAIPWSSLGLDTDRGIYTMDVSRERLENAPGFDKDNWPNMANEEWGRRVHEYYDAEPYWLHV